MARSVTLYFDCPDKRCTLQIQLKEGAFFAEEMYKGVSDMVGAPVHLIDNSEYNRLTKLYKGE